MGKTAASYPEVIEFCEQKSRRKAWQVQSPDPAEIEHSFLSDSLAA